MGMLFAQNVIIFLKIAYLVNIKHVVNVEKKLKLNIMGIKSIIL